MILDDMKRQLHYLAQKVFGITFDDLMARGCDVQTRCAVSKPYIAITFDDGPSPFGTQAILDILRKSNTPASFFLLGRNIERYPELASLITHEGHEVGSHGYSHPDYHRISPIKLYKDMKQGIDSLGKKGDIYFRSPFGHFRFDMSLYKRHLKIKDYVGWSISPAWNETSPERVIEYIEERLAPGKIIVLHDGSDLSDEDPHGTISTTIQALPKIITMIQDKGLEPVTLSKLFNV